MDFEHVLGIAQWDRARWKFVRKFANDRGLSEWDLQTQLRFVWYELHTTEQKAFEFIFGTKRVNDAAFQVYDKYERASGGLENRKRFARTVYARY